jgi:hypothetical protein
MMKRLLYVLGLLTALVSCKDEDVNIFDKSADERAAEAIASLKQELVAPADGWRIKYRPEAEAGSFYVLMDFDENDKVTIKTDLGADNGEYFEQTISYRIYNSLGLELILENYSFFSFLFEQDQATFGAEYEFNFVNKTPDNALVFNSKTDEGVPTILLFEKASPADAALLGVELSANLNVLANDFKKFTSSLKLAYDDKDLALYISLDERRRTLSVTSASLKTNTQSVQDINFSTPYLIQGDSLILDKALQGNILGSAINLRSVRLNQISEGSLAVCADPIPVHSYSGVTSQGDNVVLETSLVDVSGKSFAQLSDFYFSPLFYIFDNGTSVSDRITTDIAGAVEMHLYYGFEIGDGTLLYGIGFVIQNEDGTVTFALRQFNPVVTDNNIVFNFEPEVSIFGDPTTANVDNVNIYLDALAAGDKTYVFELSQDVYEFYNPCSGWSFVFINANR